MSIEAQVLKKQARGFVYERVKVDLQAHPELVGPMKLKSYQLLGESSTRIEELPILHTGFFDSHLHASWLGEMRRRVIGENYKDFESYVQALEDAVNEAEEDSILISYGFDDERWGLNKEEFLEKVSQRLDPTKLWMLFRLCGHSAVVSAELLKRYMPQHPSCLLDDREMHIMIKRLPEPQVDDLKEDFLEAQKLLLAKGVSAIGDMSLEKELLAAIEAVEKSSLLALDYQGILLDKSRSELEQKGPFSRDVQGPLGIKRYEIKHWKRYLDGSFGSRTAYLQEDYCDKQGERGLCLFELDELVQASSLALSRGFALSFHAIGDAALEQILSLSQRLDAQLKSVAKIAGYPVHRIEHAQLCDDRQLKLLQKLGYWTICAQPYHHVADRIFVVKRLGPERFLRDAYRMGSFVKAQIPVSLSSDAPIADFDPKKTIEAVVAHPSEKERMSFEEVFYLYTVQGRVLHSLPVIDVQKASWVFLYNP